MIVGFDRAENWSHPLTEQEFSILNKGLKYGILPTHFDFLSTQTTFEKLYHDTRSFLNWKDRIELKRILMNLYSKISPVSFSQNQIT